VGNPQTRSWIIGDVHGCLRMLEFLLQKVEWKEEVELIFLGDLVDKGPDSAGVIEWLLQQKSSVRVVRGNHEWMMLRARADVTFERRWLGYGGKETLNSYGVKDLKGVPDSHWDFLERTMPYIELENDLCVHAAANTDLALVHQSEQQLCWDKVVPKKLHASGKRMIYGHDAQMNGRVLDLGYAVNIDTYAHGGGWLTALDLKNNQCWQINQEQELRCINLKVN
jgi:serine/threonine protein phosphatase 1